MNKEIQNTNTIKNESITLLNRSTLTLSGVSEIISSSDTNLIIKLQDTNLTIQGSDINIRKLDISTGILEATGNFSSFKYGNGKSVSSFKRLFR